MDCPWQWQTDTQIALFLAWASSSWVGGQRHPAHAMPRPLCPTLLRCCCWSLLVVSSSRSLHLPIGCP